MCLVMDLSKLNNHTLRVRLTNNRYKRIQNKGGEVISFMRRLEIPLQLKSSTMRLD